MSQIIANNGEQNVVNNLPVLTLSSITTGLIIGYYRQKIADSGDIYLDKIFTSITISIFSYLLAVFLSVFSSIKYKKLNYIWVAILGSALCSLFVRVIKFLIDNWKYRKSESIIGYINELLGRIAISFTVSFLICSVLSLLIFSAIYLLHRGLSRTLNRP